MIHHPSLRESWILQPFLFTLLAHCLLLSARGQTTLYSTEFEAPTFVASTTALKDGKDGWVLAASGLSAAVANIQPVYGVDSGKVAGQGQTAYIGSETPLNTSSLYSVYRATPLTSFATNQLIRLTATIGIGKSFDVKDANGIPTGIQYASLGRNDTFRLAFYNNGLNNDGQTRKVMASIEWPTYTTSTVASGTIYRGDSSTDTQGKTNAFSTEVDIIYGEALQLNVLINFQTNRWSATLGDSPLFLDTVFRSPTKASTIPITGFGMVAVQWAITPYNLLYDHPGNNWMFFDDWNITSEPLEQMTLGKFELTSNNAKLTWATELGYSYRVEYSTNLSTWLKTLPGSLITPIESTTNQTFTDTSPISGARYYRVRRAVSGTSGL
jgi:hypothetical protein